MQNPLNVALFKSCRESLETSTCKFSTWKKSDVCGREDFVHWEINALGQCLLTSALHCTQGLDPPAPGTGEHQGCLPSFLPSFPNPVHVTGMQRSTCSYNSLVFASAFCKNKPCGQPSNSTLSLSKGCCSLYSAQARAVAPAVPGWEPSEPS